MQRLKIVHQTYYNFSGMVSLGPHTLRLRPREGHELRIESSILNINPPATLRWHRDAENNSVATATFEMMTAQLAVESTLIVQQFDEEPLDFLIADYAVYFPFTYPNDDLAVLNPYLQLESQTDTGLLADWVAHIWQPGEAIQTFVLLERICRHIHQTLPHRVREEPGVQRVDQTLIQGGSCRDFALLFMEAARYLGVAARFVSGYLRTPPSEFDRGATHAWAEVFLPGAGWKGFDGTTGEIVGKNHIAVAVSRLPESIPPIEGSFVGLPGSTLDVGVWVAEIVD